jgi:hypothetical protein
MTVSRHLVDITKLNPEPFSPHRVTASEKGKQMSENARSIHTHTEVTTIRPLGTRDAAAVKRLAQRDSAREPAGALLGAELDGQLLAVISTTTGEVVADPFQRTAEIVHALRLRVDRVDGRARGHAIKLLSRLRRASDTGAALPASYR